MRKELELINKIEDYLDNRLPADEKARFEEQLTNDLQLQEAVQLQREVMKGVERAALKQQVQQAGQHFMRWRNFTRWGLGGLSVVIISAVTLYLATSHDQTTYKDKQLPVYNEAGEKQWADADKNIPAQVFTIQAGKDTVIETNKGIVLAVPANGFLDENDQPFTGPMSLVVKEAMDAATVMQAGLSTMSGDQLLETGGMFYIDARQDNKRLKINPAAGIYAEVPTDTIRPGMQLYSGKRLLDGRIDWVNPAPLEKDLVPVDILSLNFYPPLYLDSLAAWGYNSHDKKFTDSLYYSMSAYFNKPPEDVYGPDSLPYYRYGTYSVYTHSMAVSPSKVQTIWSNNFQNTLLATREFEERMPWIHRSHRDAILDLYVNNLDKNLWEIDSMAATLFVGELWAPYDNVRDQFLAFAARKDGKVKGSSASRQTLQDYYRRKASAFEQAAIKTNDAFWKQQAALDAIANQKQQEHVGDSVKRTRANIEEEFAVNLKEAARQLGYDTGKKLLPPPASVYRVELVSTGWYNIDRAVFEATVNRTTLDITDSVTGKKAVIRYLPVSFLVEQSREYERLYVYLLPDKLNSFMRLNGENGRYTESLNELMAYSAVVIGYKGEQAFSYTLEGVKPQEYANIRLQPMNKDELTRQLNKIGKLTQAAEMKKEQEYFRFEHRDQRRRLYNGEQMLLIWNLIMLMSDWHTRPPRA